MALIKCKECGKEFSDKAEACPQCGNPNDGYSIPTKKVATNTFKNTFTKTITEIIATILGVAILIIIIFYVGKSIIPDFDFSGNKENILKNCEGLEKMTVAELYDKNLENELYAKEHYVGNAYIFIAKVETVDKKYVTLLDDENYVGVYFQDMSKFVEAKKGDVIKFCARVDDYGWLGGVNLKEGIIIE